MKYLLEYLEDIQGENLPGFVHSTLTNHMLNCWKAQEKVGHTNWTHNFWPLLLMLSCLHSQNGMMFYHNFPQRKIKVLLFQHFYIAVQQLGICINWLWYWQWFFFAVVGYAPFLLQMVFSQVCKIGWEADALLWIDSYPNTNHDFWTFSVIKYQSPIGSVCGVGFLVVLYFNFFLIT